MTRRSPSEPDRETRCAVCCELIYPKNVDGTWVRQNADGSPHDCSFAAIDAAAGRRAPGARPAPGSDLRELPGAGEVDR